MACSYSNSCSRHIRIVKILSCQSCATTYLELCKMRICVRAHDSTIAVATSTISKSSCPNSVQSAFNIDNIVFMFELMQSPHPNLQNLRGANRVKRPTCENTTPKLPQSQSNSSCWQKEVKYLSEALKIYFGVLTC